MPRSCLGSVLTTPMGGGGVTPLSCLGSTVGCIGSPGTGVVDLDWPGVVNVLACIKPSRNKGEKVPECNHTQCNWGPGFESFAVILGQTLNTVCTAFLVCVLQYDNMCVKHMCA